MLLLKSLDSEDYAKLLKKNTSLIAINAPSEERFNNVQLFFQEFARHQRQSLGEMIRCRKQRCCIIDNSTRLLDAGATKIPVLPMPLFYMDSEQTVYTRVGDSNCSFLCEGRLVVTKVPIASEQATLLRSVTALKDFPRNATLARSGDDLLSLYPVGSDYLSWRNCVVLIDSQPAQLACMGPLLANPQKYHFDFTMNCLIELDFASSPKWLADNQQFFFSSVATLAVMIRKTSDIDALAGILTRLNTLQSEIKPTPIACKIILVLCGSTLQKPAADVLCNKEYAGHIRDLIQVVSDKTLDKVLEPEVLQRKNTDSNFSVLTVAYVTLTNGSILSPLAETSPVLPGITSRKNLQEYQQSTAWRIKDYFSLEECFTKFVSNLVPLAESALASEPLEGLATVFRDSKIVIDCRSCEFDEIFVARIIKFINDVRAIDVHDKDGYAVHFLSIEIAILIHTSQSANAMKLNDAFLGQPWNFRRANVAVCPGSISYFFFTANSLEQRVVEILESSAHSPFTRGQEFAREEFMNARDFPSRRGLLHILIRANRRFVALNELVDFVLAQCVHHKPFMLATEGKAMLGYMNMKDIRGRTPMHECAIGHDAESRDILNKWSGPGVDGETDNAGFTWPAIEVSSSQPCVILKTEHTPAIYLFCLGDELGKELPSTSDVSGVDPKVFAMSKERCNYCNKAFTFHDAATGVVANTPGISQMNSLLKKYSDRKLQANNAASANKDDDEGDRLACFYHRRCFEDLFAEKTGQIIDPRARPSSFDEETQFAPFSHATWKEPLAECPNCHAPYQRVVLFATAMGPPSGFCAKCFDLKNVVHPIPLESRWRLKGNRFAIYRGGGKYETNEAGQKKFVRDGLGGFFVSPPEGTGNSTKIPSYVTRCAWNELKAVPSKDQPGKVDCNLFELGLYVRDSLLIPMEKLCKTPEKLFGRFVVYGDGPWPTEKTTATQKKHKHGEEGCEHDGGETKRDGGKKKKK